MKDWAENAEIAVEAAESGWFKSRLDLGGAQSGFICAMAWELLDVKGEPFDWFGI